MQVIRHDADHMDNGPIRFARLHEAIENFFANVLVLERISIATLHIHGDMPGRSSDFVGIERQALSTAGGYDVWYPLALMN